MYSPDSAFTGRHPVVGPYPARMTRTRNYEFDFMSCFSKHISDYEKAGRKGSAANYRSSYRLLLSFLDGQHLTSQHLSARWAERYERWLRARGVTTNTVTFHLRNLRAVYNRSVKKRFIPASFPNPFFHLTVRQTVTRKRALSRETIKRICTADLSALHPKYSLARDIFMFSFFTRGMSFVDMAYLKKSDVSDSTLTYRRRKTGQTLSVGWEQQMQAIVDRYATEKATSYLLPLITREDGTERTQYESKMQQVNRHLKKIGQQLGLPIPLTTYCARHSWATIARDRNVPLAVISEALGHDNEQTTRIYLDSIRTSVVDDANRMIIEGL